MSSGCVSQMWLRSSGNIIQGCLFRIQKCAVGRSQEVSSKVPARMARMRSGLQIQVLPRRGAGMNDDPLLNHPLPTLLGVLLFAIAIYGAAFLWIVLNRTDPLSDGGRRDAGTVLGWCIEPRHVRLSVRRPGAPLQPEPEDKLFRAMTAVVAPLRWSIVRCFSSSGSKLGTYLTDAVGR
jgi:hypothetical protein